MLPEHGDSFTLHSELLSVSLSAAAASSPHLRRDPPHPPSSAFTPTVVCLLEAELPLLHTSLSRRSHHPPCVRPSFCSAAAWRRQQRKCFFFFFERFLPRRRGEDDAQGAVPRSHVSSSQVELQSVFPSTELSA